MAEISQINGIWEAILWGIAWLVEKFYLFAQDWGLAIILFTIVFRLIMIILLPRLFGEVGVWLAFPVTEGLCALGSIACILYFRQKDKSAEW